MRNGNYIVPFNKYGFCILKETKYRDGPYKEYATIGGNASVEVWAPPLNPTKKGDPPILYDITMSDNPMQDGRCVILMYYGTSVDALKFNEVFWDYDLKTYFAQKWPGFN